MKLCVLDAATLGNDLDLSVFSEFGEVEIYERTAPEELAARIAEAEVLLLNKIRLGKAELSAAKKLRLICVAATGYDNIDLEACRALGIGVCNVPGYSVYSVSQVTVSMALSLWCHLPSFAGCVASGEYTRGGVANRLTPVYREIYGKTWGILGYGGIGKQVAQVARAMGCRVLYSRLHPDADPSCVDADRLCCESDILSIHTPLTDKTRKIINADRLALMKKDTLLINMARGGVLDEAAVADAILAEKLGGFGCDVYTVEPLSPDHPYQKILGLPNVCLTPHMAWGAYEARVRCRDVMAMNIRIFLKGQYHNRVDLL